MPETWNRGDGQPDPPRLDEAVDQVLQNFVDHLERRGQSPRALASTHIG